MINMNDLFPPSETVLYGFWKRSKGEPGLRMNYRDRGSATPLPRWAVTGENMSRP